MRRALSLHATSAVRKLVQERIQPRWAQQLAESGGDGGDRDADEVRRA